MLIFEWLIFIYNEENRITHNFNFSGKITQTFPVRNTSDFEECIMICTVMAH